MPKIAYVGKNFRGDSLRLIEKANAICIAYAQQGYNLTLRQLYYQFVSRGWLANSMESYKRLGSIVNDARLAGLIDWDHLEDRTRELERLPQWDDVEHIMYSISQQFRTRIWDAQPEYVEVWVEKQALADVVSRPAERWMVPYFPCRGYVSQSEMWAAAQRLLRHESRGKPTVIIHLGDHDPSGIDMSRDIRDRLHMFGSDVHVIRIALNMDQVDEYGPPPNPAKLTDSRAGEYVEIYGYESWELDALDPATLDALIESFILEHLDRDQWDIDYASMQQDRRLLTAASENWADLSEFIRDSGWLPDAPEGEEDES